MPYCPQCRAEYMPGIKVCAEHGVPLVAHLPDEVSDLIDEDDWQVVYTSMQEYEAEMIRGRLMEEGILARVLSQADHALGINVGDLAVVHVCVHNDDAEDARRIIAEEDTIDPDTLDSLANEPGDDE